MSRYHLPVLTILLIGTGMGIFLYKFIVLGVPATTNPIQANWSVEARISFKAKGGPVKVKLFLPQGGAQLPMIEEGYTSRGFGLTSERIDGQRATVWAIREASGRYNLYYRGRFFWSMSVFKQVGEDRVPPPEEEDSDIVLFRGPHLTAAENLMERVKQESADVATMSALLIRRLSSQMPTENAALLLGPSPTRRSIVNTAVKLLELAGTRARAAHGIKLEPQRLNAPVRTWLEVWDGERWLAFDPAFPDMNRTPNYLLWWTGPLPMASIQGATGLEVTISVTRSEDVGVSQGMSTGGGRHVPALLRFSTLSLPTDIQLLYRIVLMLPLGALLLVLIRNVIGFKTLGTFMPVLIALAFRETELLRGVVLFVLIVLAGLTVRAYLERLQLLLVPRLAAVLSTVVLMMVAFSIISHHLDLGAGLSIALFPMVILTMTIERMMVVWDELGAGEAFSQGAGSLAAAVAAYLVMNIDAVQHLIFVFPELLLVVVAMLLLLGRYSGYRLTELPRFKVLARTRG